MIESSPETDTAAAVLAAARSDRAVADAAEARLLQHAVTWAAMHSVDSIEEAETLVEAAFGDSGLPLAGEGAPLVAEFAVTEFAAAIGLSTDAGKRYLGHALELRHRLPRVWKRVQSGELPAWRGRMVAERTLLLSPEAAAFVDRHVAATVHKVGPGQLQRLVDQAIGTFMPEEAERRRLAAADGRYFTIEAQSNAFDGTAPVHGQLDLPDAKDLEHAIQAVAAELKDLGSTDSLDVRRSIAVGELARHQLAFNFPDHRDPTSVEPVETPHRNHRQLNRQLVLYVHLSQDALTARLEHRNQLITPGQVRDWCGDADQVIVKPVLDPTAHDPVDAPTVPDRHTEIVAVRDATCVFPWCTRSARRCDTDHITPAARGGPTCPCNEAALCRRHHRIKTHGAWTYTTLEPGTYLWQSPHGYQYLRDPTGTTDATPAPDR